MSVLVTGGAGFIGSHTVCHLLESGARVRVFDNFSSGKPENLPTHDALEIVTGDIRDAAAVNAAMTGISHVVHLAAQVSVALSVEDPVNSAAQNVGGFLNVLDAARRAGVARFVYASSAAVYGAPAMLPVRESTPAAPLSPYGLDKWVDDLYASLFLSLYGLSTLGMRYFNVYGPRQDPRSPYSGVISIFADRLGAGMPLTIYGDGEQTRDFIYVGDVARANAAALGASSTGVCNVATGQQISLLALIDSMARITGTSPDILFAAARTGDIRHSVADPSGLARLGIDQFVPLDIGLRSLLEPSHSSASSTASAVRQS